MALSPGRLGFWFREPIVPPRPQRKKALMFFDYWTEGPYAMTDYYRGGDVNPASDVFSVIGPLLERTGLTVDYATSYSQIMDMDLDQYSQLWDVGYASPYISNPTVNPTLKLEQYLKNGGSMFIMGENSWFGARDDAIDIFVTGLGGGNITRSFVDHNFIMNSTVYPEFRLANQAAQTTFNRPGTFVSLGAGTPMASGVNNEFCAVMWKTGSLVQAPKGAIVSVLDINIFTRTYLESNFVDNVIASLKVK
jgi:hypothetical protein